MVVSIVICAQKLGKGGAEVLEIIGRGEIIQTAAWLRLARILRRVLEASGDFLSLRSM